MSFQSEILKRNQIICQDQCPRSKQSTEIFLQRNKPDSGGERHRHLTNKEPGKLQVCRETNLAGMSAQ